MTVSALSGTAHSGLPAWTVGAFAACDVFTSSRSSAGGRGTARIPGPSARSVAAVRGAGQASAPTTIWPHPYKQITVVDPADLRAGGMEYPTLITGDTTWWMPEGLRLVELVVEHEFGHQYWYGMVATNEFEDAWLDEGINSYTECGI